MLNGKRPLDSRTQSEADVIDLTFDSDEERPSKRQRSESNTTPPLHYDGTAKSSSKRPSASAPSRDPSSYPGFLASQKPGGLSNGVNNLSLRPSPKPKQSQPSDIIDLDTDSDHGKKASNQGRHPPGKPDRSFSPVRQAGLTSTASFIVQDVEPIRFDPTSPDPIPSTNSIAPRSKAVTSPSSIRKPFVQIPPKKALSVSSDIHTHKTQQSTLSSQTLSKAAVVVKLPPHPSQLQAKSKEIVKKLKANVSYIREHPQEVSKVVGVLPFDNAKLDVGALRKARQIKHKKVDRKDLALNFSSLSIQQLPQSTTLQLVHPRQQARQILQERFKQLQPAPLSFENSRNTRQINGKFQFVSDYILSKKVRMKAKKLPLLQPRDCQCIGGCGLQCGCLPLRQKMTGTNGIEHIVDVKTYIQRDDGTVVLSNEFIEKWSAEIRIFECGENCSCPQSCINRVVQKGRQIPLQVFETQHCGFGVRSPQDIVKGQFIDVYLGEVLTTSEVARREAAAEEDTPSYVMSLDLFIQDEQAIFHVDGEIFGSVTRFVNHCCEPNCTTLPVVLSNDTRHLYHVAFFATKDIPAGTELTIDYSPGSAEDEDILDASAVQCRCGSQNCRKRLWPRSKEKRGRKRLLPSKDDD